MPILKNQLITMEMFKDVTFEENIEYWLYQFYFFCC